ncbi:DUF3369 domain-containing protein [Motiliproteus sp. MSK22-1]|uniref:DUF3369 domain-containing protein n=1 Tax=Motiliproteus sp. MSK22-1 TaxID=1897630 RepID=UPI000975E49D|nr:DUF3369 domain-containing protein [Motiliproteus sp. MSK22-1]OMH25891.1 hypothetical protein BGP75_25610 [Motiliproteus sp. MSK22-1]
MSDVFVFAEDEEHPQPQGGAATPRDGDDTSGAEILDRWKVMIVDDDESVHQVTRLALKRVELDGRPLEFISAHSGEEAKNLIQEHDDVALVLLDIVMETDNAGFEVANFIRHDLGNHMTRIILRTGQPGDVPERDVILNYEIDGYKTKSELTSQALFSVILTSLRSYRDLCRVEDNNRRLDSVVEATSEIFEQHTVDSFVDCLLLHLRNFIPMAPSSEGAFYFAADYVEGRLGFLAGSESMAFKSGDEIFQHLPSDVRALVLEAQNKNKPLYRDGHLILVGRSKAERSLTLYFSDVKPLNDSLWHMLEILCRNFETAFENLLLGIENENHRRNLETRVQERTVQLGEARDRLIHAERMASIGQLAAGVAHEINNPLGFIKSNILMLSDSFEKLLCLSEHYQALEVKGTDEQLVQLKTQLKSADLAYLSDELPSAIFETGEGIDRIRRIVSDLRDFASNEEGKFQETDLNLLLETQLRLLPKTLTGDVDIRCEFEVLPLLLLMDVQLKQAITNIMTNAFEAMSGKGTFRLATARQDNSVIITIADTGCGIAENNKSRIFDPFFTTKDVGQGTGLGLSLSYSVIKFHNGDVSVTSDPGVGTTFCIKIPIMVADSLDSSHL